MKSDLYHKTMLAKTYKELLENIDIEHYQRDEPLHSIERCCMLAESFLTSYFTKFHENINNTEDSEAYITEVADTVNRLIDEKVNLDHQLRDCLFLNHLRRHHRRDTNHIFPCCRHILVLMFLILLFRRHNHHYLFRRHLEEYHLLMRHLRTHHFLRD